MKTCKCQNFMEFSHFIETLKILITNNQSFSMALGFPPANLLRSPHPHLPLRDHSPAQRVSFIPPAIKSSLGCFRMTKWRLSDDPHSNSLSVQPSTRLLPCYKLAVFSLKCVCNDIMCPVPKTAKFPAPKSIKIHINPQSSKAASFISCCCFCVAWRRSCRNSSLTLCGFAPWAKGRDGWDGMVGAWKINGWFPANHLLEKE